MTERPTIVGLGEILWDVFPDGARFGGAPTNFACCVASLSEQARVHMVSNVGDDRFGRFSRVGLESRRVDISCVKTIDRPTGEVLIELDVSGSASYNFAPDSAWDEVAWSDEIEQLAARTDAVCFGTLGQRSELSRRTICQFLVSTQADALRIFDVNLRPPFYSDEVIRRSLVLANVLKLNDEELPVLASLYDLSGSTVEMLRQLASRFELRAVALTRGPAGSVLVRGQQQHEQPGIETKVVDTVGAGDAFTAALTLGLLQGAGLAQINQRANRVAAFVCSESGATPKIPADL